MTAENEKRLQMATSIAQGLLASQNPDKGWNLETLSILSLKITDSIIEFSKLERLPELINAEKKEE
jgi:hypothetical protein